MHSIAPSAPAQDGTLERIRQRAYELYQARGSEPGHEQEDWFRAEHEVQEAGAADGGRSSFPAQAGDAIAERERENEMVRRNARGPRRSRAHEASGGGGDAPGVRVTAGHGKDAHSVNAEEDFEIDGVDPSAVEAAARSRRPR